MKFWLAVGCVAVLVAVVAPDRRPDREEQKDSPAEASSFDKSYSEQQPKAESFSPEQQPKPEARNGYPAESFSPEQQPQPEARNSYPAESFSPEQQPQPEARNSYPSEDYHVDEHAQDRDYKPAPPKKCYPQTITKYRTIMKDRKANVFNKVEIRNPRPQVHKTKETRHTTIRYPVFITQVIKPLLTQVETKVKPLFFTKTLKRIKTIVFTVTGIGQVTVTSVKYEKEYVTRCQKKGYGDHGGGHKGGHGGGYHRREDHDYLDPDYVSSPSYVTDRIESYEDVPMNRRRPSARYRRDVMLAPSIAQADISEASSAITNPLPFLSA